MLRVSRLVVGHHVRVMGAYKVTLRHHGIDTDWMALGACEGMRPAEATIFFRDEDRGVAAKRDTLEAKEMCHGCAVEAECLAYAFEAQMQGVWGGTTFKERQRILGRARRRA